MLTDEEIKTEVDSFRSITSPATLLKDHSIISSNEKAADSLELNSHDGVS